MVEDTKEQTPSQDSTSDAEKKQASVAMPPVRPVATATAASTPPRPAAAPPRPQPQAPPPATQPAQQKPSDRRMFIKLLVFISAILAVIPFVPWGNFLLSSVSSSGAYKRQLAVLDMNTTTNRNANGAVAGKKVNVNDLSAFPPNGTWLMTYPSSGDLTTDSQNPDSFQKFQLIRLPSELGGSSKSAAAFVAFSKVCVHLWCSPNYNPTQTTNPNEYGYQKPGPNVTTHEEYECPCHGSIYKPPNGLAVAGPASVQPAPTNAIPMLTLTADTNGDLYIEPPIWDVDHNGVLGYGRNYQSYENFILPKAKAAGSG